MRSSDTLRGAALMAAAAAIFALEAVVLRYLSARGVPVGVQLFARTAGQLLWVLPIMLAMGPRVFRTQRLPMHLARGASSLTCWGLYYLSLTMLDLATATALSFTAVMITAVLAGPVLGERVGAWRWAAAVIGFAGIVLMLRPGGGADPLGAVVAIASAVAWCGITLTSRSLTHTDMTATIMAWVGLTTFLGALPVAILTWKPMALADAAVLAAIALVTPSLIWLTTEALRIGEASAIAPLQYLRLPVLALAGWLVWGEAPDAWSWVGTAAILAGALLVTVMEARRR
ncbi:DMT family transporter [Roseomonas sp. AR75]|uniref:DMT family transporter n=1 Tax=Roseomonas sp. AR75 TaxID=2562311 RepID=UPI00210F6DCD|nr:DMT family transporter [Roseomonas sp. AR75]